MLKAIALSVTIVLLMSSGAHALIGYMPTNLAQVGAQVPLMLSAGSMGQMVPSSLGSQVLNTQTPMSPMSPSLVGSSLGQAVLPVMPASQIGSGPTQPMVHSLTVGLPLGTVGQVYMPSAGVPVSQSISRLPISFGRVFSTGDGESTAESNVVKHEHQSQISY
jgi:hypothetical protein